MFTHYFDVETLEWVELPENQRSSYPSFAYNDPENGYPVWKPDYNTCDIPQGNDDSTQNVIWVTTCVSE